MTDGFDTAKMQQPLSQLVVQIRHVLEPFSPKSCCEMLSQISFTTNHTPVFTAQYFSHDNASGLFATHYTSLAQKEAIAQNHAWCLHCFCVGHLGFGVVPVGGGAVVFFQFCCPLRPFASFTFQCFATQTYWWWVEQQKAITNKKREPNGSLFYAAQLHKRYFFFTTYNLPESVTVYNLPSR